MPGKRPIRPRSPQRSLSKYMNVLEINCEQFAPSAESLKVIGLAGGRLSLGAFYSKALGSPERVPPPVVRSIHCAAQERLAHS